MTRKRAVFLVALLMIAALAAFVWYCYQKQDKLVFAPEQGKTRYYEVNVRKIATPAAGAYLDQQLFSYSLRMQAIGSEGDDVIIAAHLDHLRDERDRDTFQKGGSRAQTVSKLAKAGIHLVVDRHGQIIRTELADPGILEKSEDISGIFQMMKMLMKSGISLGSPFPDDRLEKGMNWTGELIPAISSESSNVMEVKYAVESLSTGTVLLSIRSTGPNADDPENTDASGKLFGHALLDRSTGQLLRYIVRNGNRRTQFEVSIRRTDQPQLYQPFFASYKLRVALQGLSIDLTREVDRKYFLPPYGITPVDQVLKVLDKQLFWIPRSADTLQYGLEVPASLLFSNAIYPVRVKAIHLLDSNGKELDQTPGLSPYFNIDTWFQKKLGGQQADTADGLLTRPLDRKQTQMLDRIEMKVQAKVPGTLQKGRITKDSGPVHLGEVTARVDSWTPKKVVVRLSRPSGFLPLSQTTFTTVPHEKGGSRIDRFHYSMTQPALQSALERARKAHPKADDETLIRAASRLLSLESLGASSSDLLITVTSSQPIGSLELFSLPYRQVEQTWTARNIGPTLNGGRVVGERTTDRNTPPPERVLKPIDVSHLPLIGISNHTLTILLDAAARSRCTLGLESPATYKGSPLRIAGTPYGDRYHLTTENGLTFFYGLDVKVKASCIARIERETADIGKSAQVHRIDDNTVMLSASAQQQMEELRKISDLKVVGRNADGEALEPLKPADGEGNPRIRRFWGKVEAVTLYHFPNRTSHTYNIRFAPLP